MEKTTVNSKTGIQTLTTQSLGIADSKEQSLAGYILSQKELSDAATKILVSVGINPDDIACIRVGQNVESKKLKVICEVNYKAAYPDKGSNKWYDFTEYDSDDHKTAFTKNFYEALYNKVYHGKRKHLNIRIVERRNKKGSNKKYVQFEFDPEIMIAFVYNIVFSDPLYKISCRPTRWLNNDELHKKFDSRARREEYRRKRDEYKKLNLANCVVYVTFAKDAYQERVKNLGNGETKTVRYKGFHPSQVDYVFGDK
jgi:hypothetical protein